MSDRRSTEPGGPTPQPPQPEHVPTPSAPPLERGEAAGGGMTEASGVLTPETESGEFVPAERREIERAGHVGQAALKRHPAAIGQGDMGVGAEGAKAGPLATERASGLAGIMADSGMGGSTTPGAGTQAGTGRSELGTYESGYGSEQGMSPDDPAYRVESHIPGDLPAELPTRLADNEDNEDDEERS